MNEQEQPRQYPIEAFFTKDLAGKPQRIALSLGDGTPTADWIDVVHVDSEQARAWKPRHDELTRAWGKADSDEKKRQLADRFELEQVARTIVAWSFAQPLTLEGAARLLENRLDLLDEVREVSTSNARFFGSKPASSSSGQEQNTGSTPPTTEASGPTP